ncbi:FliH/SctL family protein [Faecalimicrobium sp. JNUCC 81]
MNSLCRESKIISSEDINVRGKITLQNNIISKVKIEEQKNLEEELVKKEEELKNKILEAENKYKEMISKANEESLNIIEESKNKVSEIEKNAYEQGYSQGSKNGYEDGYKEAYEENVEKAKTDAESILNNANNVLEEAKNYVVEYLKANKNQILGLSVSIAEQVLREKFTETSFMDNMILNVIEEYELKENFIIKTNSIYKESLQKQILELKESYKINGDVFVLSDESVEQGNAIIETSKGKLIIGVDSVLKEIKEELL